MQKREVLSQVVIRIGLSEEKQNAYTEEQLNDLCFKIEEALDNIHFSQLVRQKLGEQGFSFLLVDADTE